MKDIKQAAVAAKIIEQSNQHVDPDVWLKDQQNKLKKLVPEYQDADVFEAERPVLLQRCYDMGLTAEQVRKMPAKDVKAMRDRILHDGEQARMDRLVESGRKKGRNPEKLVMDLIRGRS